MSQSKGRSLTRKFVLSAIEDNKTSKYEYALQDKPGD
jgi:hypothetical protein